MDPQDWLNWKNTVREAGEHPNGRDTVNGGSCQGRDGNDPNWAIDELMSDIEQQMDEQNEALAGMTKKLEGIEVSLALHESASSCVSRSAWFKRTSYISMGDDDDEEGGAASDSAKKAWTAKNESPASCARGVMRVLQRKSQLNKQQTDECEDGPSPSEASTAIEMDAFTTTSNTTRHAGNAQPIMTDSKISIVQYGASSRRDLTPPNRSQGRIDPSMRRRDEEIPPPPPLPARLGFNMDPVASQALSTSKHFRSSTTWEESDCSNSASVVSELEETISGKTWAFRSRRSKTALVCLAAVLVLMLGLVVGQSKGAKKSQQEVSEQSIDSGLDPNFVPPTAPIQPSVPSTPTQDGAQPVAEAALPPNGDPTTAAEPTEPPVAAPTEPQFDPTSLPVGPPAAPVDPPTSSPAEQEDDTSDGDMTGYDYRADTDYLVGVYYYLWHGDNFHGGEYLRHDLNPRHQPTLGEYNDSDPATIAQHMAWFRQANIGLLVTSWWGPNRLEDTNTKDVIMQHEDIGNLKIALHYETTGRIGDGLDLLVNAKTDIEYMCENYFDHPNYYKIDDRPVIFIYISRHLETTGTLEEALLTMRSTGSKCGQNLYLVGDSVFQSAPDPSKPHVPFWYFDAVTNYDVYGSSGQPEGYVGTDRVDDYYLQQAGWKEEALKDNCHYIPAVSPGYNDRSVRIENDHPPLSRRITSTAQEGSLLHYQLGHAKQLADEKVDRMILVNSFNEWHEDTQLEPAIGEPATLPWNLTKGIEYVGYGELYLDILGAATSKDESRHSEFDYLYDP